MSVNVSMICASLIYTMISKIVIIIIVLMLHFRSGITTAISINEQHVSSDSVSFILGPAFIPLLQNVRYYNSLGRIYFHAILGAAETNCKDKNRTHKDSPFRFLPDQLIRKKTTDMLKEQFTPKSTFYCSLLLVLKYLSQFWRAPV